MAQARFIKEVAELDDELHRLEQTQPWMVPNPQNVSAPTFALFNNLAAIANRQDAYYQVALQKFVEYDKAGRNGVSAVAQSKSTTSKKSTFTPSPDIEQQAADNWSALSNLLEAFEKAGQPLLMRRSEKSSDAALNFWSFCAERLTAETEDPKNALRSILGNITDEQDQEGYFIDWCSSLKGTNRSKEKKYKLPILESDEDKEVETESLEDDDEDADDEIVR